MAVFRIEKTRDYTVMSNHHLRNTALSLKAKGLWSLMLSLPEGWDYTTKGLARICKDGVDSICTGVREMEEQGYVIRERVRNANGQLGAIEYTILEQPRTSQPEREKPGRENLVQANPVLENPAQEKPEQGNPAQLNTKESSNYGSITDLSNTEVSNPIQSNPQPLMGRPPAGIGTDGMGAREVYREIILDNIEYRYLIQEEHIDREQLDEIAELIVDTVCSARKTIRIAGDDYPAEVVKSRFMKLDSSHVRYVMDCMRENTTYVRNIKKYLLAALYNAPATIGNYYSSLVQHDMSKALEQASWNLPYIIHGSSFRLLVGSIFELLARYCSLKRRIQEVRTEKDFLRLQKQTAKEGDTVPRLCRSWGVPEGEDMTSHDVLERAIRRKHLIPVREADLVLVCGEDGPDDPEGFEDSEGMDLPDDFDDLDGYDEPDDPGEGWDE